MISDHHREGETGRVARGTMWQAACNYERLPKINSTMR